MQLDMQAIMVADQEHHLMAKWYLHMTVAPNQDDASQN